MYHQQQEEWNVISGGDSVVTSQPNLVMPNSGQDTNPPNLVKDEGKFENDKNDKEEEESVGEEEDPLNSKDNHNGTEGFEGAPSDIFKALWDFTSTEIHRLKGPTQKSLADCIDRLDNFLDQSKKALERLRNRLITTANPNPKK